MPDEPKSNDNAELQRDDLLSKFEQQDVSMYGLVKTLLSSSTMPHIIMILFLSVIFYTTARIDSLTVFSAMAFTSLSASYIITAMLSNNRRVSDWITLGDDNSASETSFLLRYLSPFRICLFPVISAGLIFALLVGDCMEADCQLCEPQTRNRKSKTPQTNVTKIFDLFVC